MTLYNDAITSSALPTTVVPNPPSVDVPGSSNVGKTKEMAQDLELVPRNQDLQMRPSIR